MKSRWLAPAVLLAAASLAPAVDTPPQEKQEKAVALRPFQVLSVTGPHAGNFHCPLCEYGLRPAIVVLVRDIEEFPKSLPSLLKRLDDLTGSHPEDSLNACAIFLNDGGYREALQNKIDEQAKVKDLKFSNALEQKFKNESRLKDLAKSADIKLLTLHLGNIDSLEGYPVDKEADLTVLLFKNLKVVESFSYTKDKSLTDDEISRIVSESEKNILPPKKKRR